MIYHGLAMIGLFATSILVFVIQTHLLKLIGLAPLAVVVMLALIWIQVNKSKKKLELQSIEKKPDKPQSKYLVSTGVQSLPMPSPNLERRI